MKIGVRGGGEARPNGLDELLARARRGRAAWGMLRAAAAQHRSPAGTSCPPSVLRVSRRVICINLKFSCRRR